VNLLTDQIEFANVIVLNKTDLISSDDLCLLKAMIRKLNPNAQIIESKFSNVPLGRIINTNLFNLEEASQSAGWIEELKKGAHKPETEEYGISSFVYRSRNPFHHIRFLDYVNNRYPATIIRSKGIFWLNSRPKQAISFSQAGGSLRAEGAGVWWSSMSFEERMRYPSFIENKEVIESRWDKAYGDRINELVIIGQDLDKTQITNELNACICSDNEVLSLQETMQDEWPI
jgi:G3E family GTPase